MSNAKIERIEDFTAHEWCNKLLSDPSITHISKRHLPDKRLKAVSNALFTRTLFTDDAIRAFLSLYRPGRGQRREIDEREDEIFTGDTPIQHEDLSPRNHEAEVQRQNAKEEKTYDTSDPDAPESFILVSLGNDIDGGIRRLHGGMTATLIDQAMGQLLSHLYEVTCATVELTIKYKKAVTTPCILLIRAKVRKEKGRWIEPVAWVEDGQGTVFAEGEGAFVLGKIGSTKL